ncbi:hypothetical protein [Microbacterium sp. NPDC087665]|uniref:hypothetical protein n=1 Tax=Microbacterium sp. NPDC087665 TaxID=3364194 RepID=UPI003804260E
MSDQPDTPRLSPLAAYVRDNPLSRYAPYRRTGRHITALVLAWISFGAPLGISALSIATYPFVGLVAIMVPMLFLFTFWFWGLIGALALLLSRGVRLCGGTRLVAILGILEAVIIFGILVAVT